jgi:hypothetical protein
MSKDTMTEVRTVQQTRRHTLVILQTFAGFIKWLADIIKLTEEEQEAAGIYLGHLGDEQIPVTLHSPYPSAKSGRDYSNKENTK